MCDDEEETFSLLLESSDPNVRLGPRSTAQVFITDDDGMSGQVHNTPHCPPLCCAAPCPVAKIEMDSILMINAARCDWAIVMP